MLCLYLQGQAVKEQKALQQATVYQLAWCNIQADIHIFSNMAVLCVNIAAFNYYLQDSGN